MATPERARVPVPDTVAGDCASCGAESTHGHPVYLAGLVDVDGTHYPRLCGTCFDALEAHIRNEPHTDPAVAAARGAAGRLERSPKSA